MDTRLVSGARVPDPRMDGVAFSMLRLDGPFALSLPITPTLNFYFVRRGRVAFECSGSVSRRVVLTANACVGLSARITHSLKSVEVESDLAKPVIRKEAMGTPDHGESVEIIVSSVPEESLLYVRAFQEVPIIFPDAAPGIADSIRRALEWIERESLNEADPTSLFIIRRMAEIIQMEIGRYSSLQKPELALSIHASNIDKRILRAMTAMYLEPARSWTLQSLADEACMSRTAFAARYRELTGITAMQGLQRLRLRRAADELTNAPSQSIDHVAGNWGYQSAAVFIRAFTREFGMTPGHWRHAAMHE